MKKIMNIFICLVCLLGFTASVNAASSSITAYNSGNKTYEYISGLPIYWNKSGSYNLYVLNTKTYYTSSTRLSEPTEVDPGFAYIINNSNVTGNSEKNYYIAQVAILWYEDYLNGNDLNISKSMKDIISSKTDTISYYINKLVNNAKNYSKNGNLINFVDDEITFYRSGDYYYSNEIEVEVNGLNSIPTVSYYNAPANTTTINNYLTKNGIGSFQIRIPVSSVDYYYNNNYNYNYNNNINEDFVVNVTSNGYNYTYYEYSNGNTMNAIYGYSYSNYSNKLEASMVAKLSDTNKSRVRIFVFDNDNDYIAGIRYEIYSGDCSKSTCEGNKLVESFTTKNTYTELLNLSEGTYTLVRVNNKGYNLPEKEVINVTDSKYLQDFILVEDRYNNNNNNYENNYTDTDAQYKVKITTNLNDSTNIIKIYRNDGVFVSSFRADKTSFEVLLYPDKYYTLDNRGVKINFEVSKDGVLSLIENNKTTKVNVIEVNKINDNKVDNSSNNNINNTVNNNTNTQTNSNNTNTTNKEEIKTENGTTYIELEDGSSIEVTQKVETNTDVKVDWLSNIVDCPITSSSTLKYIIGAIVLGMGIVLVVLNVKKNKNNI